MIPKVAIVLLMFLYLYTLTFNIFIIKVVPNALLFGLPLLLLVAKPLAQPFVYKIEVIVLFIAAFFLYVLGYQDIKYFTVVIIVVTFCSLYFNYVIASDLNRFNQSIAIFYILLAFSSLVMILNHYLPSQIDRLRSILKGGELIIQSPSGISANVFSFGYQVAALCTFAVVAVTLYKQKLAVAVLVFGLSMYIILYGMNRSAFVAVGCAVLLFWLLYYKHKVILIFGFLAIVAFSFKTTINDLSSGRKQNILSKNERSADGDRGDLMTENIKILLANPYGLIFADKTWEDVAGRNPVFRIGQSGLVTSHNSYLMFVTYLGLVLGGILLFLIYRKIIKITWIALSHIKDKDYALLVCLCCSFLAISINALFHNEWLLGSGCGPTLFLYFSVLHF
jgi:hypothetical protein